MMLCDYNTPKDREIKGYTFDLYFSGVFTAYTNPTLLYTHIVERLYDEMCNLYKGFHYWTDSRKPT